MVDAKRSSHKHVLRPLNNFIVNFQQVGPFKCLEAEEVVGEVARIINDLVDALVIFSNDLVHFIRKERCGSSGPVCEVVEPVSGHLHATIGAVMQGLYCDAIGKICVVWVDDCHVCTSFGG